MEVTTLYLEAGPLGSWTQPVISQDMGLYMGLCTITNKLQIKAKKLPGPESAMSKEHTAQTSLSLCPLQSLGAAA